MHIVITKPAVAPSVATLSAARPCAVCAAALRATQGKFCGQQCRSRWGYARRIERADLTCAKCSEPMALARTSAPQGTAVCRPCRRAAHGLGPNESVSAAKKAQQRHRADCHRCGIPVPAGSRRWKFCSDECFRKNRNARGSGGVRPSTAARGYDSAHQKLRAELLATAYGTRCHLCDEVMEEGQSLHLDHTEDRSGYRGMSHAECNIRDGAKRGGERSRQKRLETGWRHGASSGPRRRSQGVAA